MTTTAAVSSATCPECGAKHTIPLVRLPSGRILDAADCPDCERKAEAREQAERERAEAAALAEKWRALCPPAYQETDPARLPQEQLEAVLGWQYGPEGLLLIGPTGAGKTRCAYLLLKRLLDEGRRIVAFDCVRFGHDCARRFRDGSGEDWSDGLAKVDLVFFDDLGKGRFTERVEAELFAVVERRLANKLPCIVTTNMTGRSLVAKASHERGEPLVRRLRESCRVVVFGRSTDAET